MSPNASIPQLYSPGRVVVVDEDVVLDVVVVEVVEEVVGLMYSSKPMSQDLPGDSGLVSKSISSSKGKVPSELRSTPYSLAPASFDAKWKSSPAALENVKVWLVLELVPGAVPSPLALYSAVPQVPVKSVPLLSARQFLIILLPPPD